MKGRKVVEFGFVEAGQANGTITEESKDTKLGAEVERTTSAAGPALRKIEIEIGTDPSPEERDLSAVAIKQEYSAEETDEVAKVVEEPGIIQPEQVVDVVMQELAREQGENVYVVKAE